MKAMKFVMLRVVPRLSYVIKIQILEYKLISHSVFQGTIPFNGPFKLVCSMQTR